MTEGKKSPNWAAIEPHWRAGIKTKLELSETYGVSRAALDKHFAKLGIERDLLPKIKAKAKAIVAKEVTQVTQKPVTQTKVTPSQVTQARLDATEDAIVDAAAAIQSDAIRRHSRGIARAWGIVDMLMQELEHQTENIDLYEQLGELMYSPDDKGVDKLNEVYRKAMSLPSRSSTVKTLLEALKTAIGLEREALGITDRTPGSDDDPLSRIIKAVQGTGLKPVSVIEGESEVVPNE